MQFHLDGFAPGDPHVAAPSPQAFPHTDSAPAQVDVLIVGCGPAGLTLAAQLAAFDRSLMMTTSERPPDGSRVLVRYLSSDTLVCR